MQETVMQNPFRHRPEDEFGRDDRDERRWEAGDRRRDEDRSWSEGDGGRTAEAWRGQGRQDRPIYGSRDRTYETDYPRDSGPYARPDYDQDRSARSQHDRGYDRSGGYGAGPTWGTQDRRGPDFGSRASMDYGSQGYSRHAYAPGSQIWEDQRPGMGSREMSSGRQQHDFEPDYLHWREQQLSNFDRDYSDWRSERRQKFSADFDTWRQNRPRAEMHGKTPAENPIVGDIADGGDGRGGEDAARKRR
jgi:hypothetical protein